MSWVVWSLEFQIYWVTGQVARGVQWLTQQRTGNASNGRARGSPDRAIYEARGGLTDRPRRSGPCCT